MKEQTLDSEELIYELSKLSLNKKYKKQKPLPRFTIREAQFIRDLIFLKPKDILYFYIADHLRNLTEVGRIGMFHSTGYRQYQFLRLFLECRGNATKAAILAGYSEKSAKQQGHRLLRRIQGFMERKV